MKRIRANLQSLLLAHAVGSYSAYFPVIFERQGLHWDWIAIILAPVFMPVYLPLLTVLHLGQYYSFQPQRWDYRFMPLTWVCYTIPFVLVCLIRRRKTAIPKLVIVPVIMTLFVAALWLHAAIVTSIPRRSPLKNKPAPDFTLTTLEGATCSISQERGHVVLLDFWESSCSPCRVELNQTIAKLAGDVALRERGLRVWTINVADDAETTRKFMIENHYGFNVMLDPQKLATNLYPGDGVPTTFLVGRDGSIRKSFSGFLPEIDQQLRTEIDAALK